MSQTLDLTNPEHQQYHLFHEVGLPAFFEVLSKRAGVVPQTVEQQTRLWELGQHLLAEHQAKQASGSGVALDRLLGKAASDRGLSQAAGKPAANIDQYASAMLADAGIKQAMTGYYRQCVG